MPRRALAYTLALLPIMLAFLSSFAAEIPKIWGTGDAPIVHTVVAGRALDLTFSQSVRILLVAASLVVAAVGLHHQHYKPFRSFHSLREETLKYIFDPQMNSMRSIYSPDMRMSILEASSIRLTRYIHIGRLAPIYHNGFKQNHPERGEVFWFVKLFGFEWAQGVCGAVVFSSRAEYATVDESIFKEYNLTDRMKEWTRDLSLLLSVPVLRWYSKTDHRCVGIINVDIRDKSIAATLLADERTQEDLLQYFMDSGEYMSKWLQ